MYYLLNYRIMKTRVFLASMFAAATIALLATSCSMNEPGELNVTTSDAISLNPNTLTTRASISYLSNLETDGFLVWAQTDGATDWYTGIAGALHTKDAGVWNFSPKVKWPENASDYPMDFYAVYPTDLVPVDNNLALVLPVTVPPLAGDQTDILASRATALAKPVNSNLNMQFGHILSKVYFSVTNDYKGDIANEEHTAFVQAVGFKYLHETNTYDVIGNVWEPYVSTTYAGEYTYYNEFFPQPSTESNALPVKVFNKVSTSTAANAKFYDSPALEASYMMLLPQATTKWVPVKDQRPEINKESHVQLIYRWEEADKSNLKTQIGFRHAEDHPDWETSQLKADGYHPQKPLFVKAGFVYTPIWEMGKGYQYNIPLPGSSGGILLDKYYYDENGNVTDLEVDGTEEGEPIFGDGYIHLIPRVTDWDDQTPIDVPE